MLPHLLLAFCLFALLTLFYGVATTLYVLSLHRRLRAKDRETEELRAALRTFEDVRQAVVYLSGAYSDLSAFHGNLVETHAAMVQHTRAVYAQAANVLRLAERAQGAEGGPWTLVEFRPDPKHVSRN